MSLYLLLLLDVFIAYTIEVLIGYPAVCRTQKGLSGG